MFGLFNKQLKIKAPVNGFCVDLDEVPDEVFSKRMMGDGVAIQPADGLFVAPADGELVMLFKTGHAYGMVLDQKVELLIHIGIDTVELQGEGFEILATQGTRVLAGTPIVRVDLDLIRQKGYDPITPIIITSADTSGPDSAIGIKTEVNQTVMAGSSGILSITT